MYFDTTNINHIGHIGKNYVSPDKAFKKIYESNVHCHKFLEF